MSLPLVVRPEANTDVREAHSHFETHSAGLGDLFLDRLQETLDRIESAPELYAEVWGVVRAARVRRFRHVIYYVVLKDRVEVIAATHGSRDPSAWQSRV